MSWWPFSAARLAARERQVAKREADLKAKEEELEARWLRRWESLNEAQDRLNERIKAEAIAGHLGYTTTSTAPRPTVSGASFHPISGNSGWDRMTISGDQGRAHIGGSTRRRDDDVTGVDFALGVATGVMMPSIPGVLGGVLHGGSDHGGASYDSGSHDSGGSSGGSDSGGGSSFSE